jgi:hypothetical protein
VYSIHQVQHLPKVDYLSCILQSKSWFLNALQHLACLRIKSQVTNHLSMRVHEYCTVSSVRNLSIDLKPLTLAKCN